MWNRLKSLNPVKYSTITEAPQRHSEDSNVGDDRSDSPIAHETLNHSTASLSSASSFSKKTGRNIFRRSRLPSEFSSTALQDTINAAAPRPSLSDVPEASSTRQAVPEHVARHVKSPSGGSGGSVRSIMRDPKAPSTGQSVRFNQRDAFRIITPNASSSTADEEENPRSFIRRLRDAGLTDEDDQPISSNVDDSPQYLPLLEEDPFAANVPLPPTPDASTSFSSTSSRDLPNIPSDMENIFDMTNEMDSIPLSDSLMDMASAFEGIPSPQLVSNESSDEISSNFTFPGVQRAPKPEAASNDQAIQNEDPSTPSHTRLSNASSYRTPQHSRMPSETPTIRPSPTSSSNSSPSIRTPQNSTSIVDATVYHTPQTISESNTNSSNFRSASLTSYARPNLKDADADMPRFLIPAKNEELDDANISHDNSAFIVPNNSIALPFPSLTLATQDDLVGQLRSRLEILESISEQYEADLSARDSLVEHLSFRIEKADEEVAAWRSEAERTTRRFERMKTKVSTLAATCDALASERKRASMFDAASSAALQNLHSRVGSLDASRAVLEERVKTGDAALQEERQRVEQYEQERDEARKAKEDGEKEMLRWKERARELERESAQAAELLNSLHGAASAAGRPTSVLVDMPSVTPSPNDDGTEQVYVLKSEIIRREQEYAELRETHRTSSFKWAEERVALIAARDQIASAHSSTQQELSVLKSELEAQWERSERTSEEISALRAGRKEAEEEVARLGSVEQEFASRMEEWMVREEELTAQIDSTKDHLAQMTKTKDEILEQLHAERQKNEEALTSSAAKEQSAIENIASLEEELTILRRHEHDFQARTQQLEADLTRLQFDDADVLEEKARRDAREEELRSELENTKETMQQLQWNRDKILEELQLERSTHDQLVDSHSELVRKNEDLARDRDSHADNERRLKELVRSLETEVTHTSAGLLDRDRECERLQAQLDRVTSDLEKISRKNADSDHNSEELREREARLQAELAKVRDAQARDASALEVEHTQLEAAREELEEFKRQLREVKQKSADLEVKHVQLVKAKKQLEDDNTGLYIGLEAKQEELEMIKRKFGVKGTAGTTPAHPTANSVQESVFKQPTLRRASATLSPTGEEDDGASSKIPGPSTVKQTRFAAAPVAANNAKPATRPIRPRVSMPTPTPAAAISRYPSLGHTRNLSSASSNASSTAADRRPIAAPGLASRPGAGVPRRSASNSDVESVGSSASSAPKRIIRPSSSMDRSEDESRASINSRSAVNSRRSSSISGTNVIEAAAAKRLPPRSSSSLGVTVEERIEAINSNKENRLPGLSGSDVDSTPKAPSRPGASVSSVRRRVMVPA